MAIGFRGLAGLACMVSLLVGGIGMTADPVSLEGKPAPDIELTAVGSGGKAEQMKLSSYKGKKNVVLAFYPRAMTPG